MTEDATPTVWAPAADRRAGAPPSPLSRYGRFYGPVALIGLAVTFVPLFQDSREQLEERDGLTSTYLNLWDAGDAGGLGVMVIMVLVVMLVVATLRRSEGFVLPLAITVWTVLPLSMLLAKYGFNDPKPDLSPFGQFSLGMMVGLLLIGAAHTTHALIERSSSG